MKKTTHFSHLFEFSVFEIIQRIKIYITLVTGVDKEAQKKGLLPIYIFKK